MKFPLPSSKAIMKVFTAGGASSADKMPRRPNEENFYFLPKEEIKKKLIMNKYLRLFLYIT